ncbi:hypothetical protein [Acinetobacter pittii]|uniref:hypothetical protein n=1 Tax=Acinetobacter pittii TaxID=48296 RepID=UPI00168CC91C|nr:hypothetical protein [Acinetobacter pittii]
MTEEVSSPSGSRLIMHSAQLTVFYWATREDTAKGLSAIAETSRTYSIDVT